MEIFSGNYKKENGEERYVELAPLVKSKEYIEGIDLTKLSFEEKEQVIEILKDYEIKISPFVKKAYRKFLMPNFKDVKIDIRK